MDIQLNIGHKALSYLCKYITKVDSYKQFSVIKANEELNDRQLHFRARTIGSIDAVYDVLGLHKQSADTDVMFLDTNMPGQRDRIIRSRLGSDGPIYYDHNIGI